jgi:hypothetical protein
MKMRLTKPTAAPGAWLIAGRSAAGAVLLAVTVSACTGGGSSVPSIFTPTPQTGGQASSTTHPGSRAPSPAGGASSTKSAGASTSPTAHASSSGSAHASTSGSPHASASDSPHASASASSRPPATTVRPTAPSSPRATHTAHTSAPVSPAYPTAAPETGGGGTAGLQDGLLFGTGGLAVFVGLGSLALRRRLTRKFRPKDTSPDPADRESATR